MLSLTLRSPAKINLFLAITGERDDGFHDLISLVCPLEFGDEVAVEIDPDGIDDRLECDFPGVPTDDRNLALRAVKVFREAVSVQGSVRVRLQKQIPAGAGLGGGSSNASTVLRALNRLSGEPLTEVQLRTVSASLGSDCPLFLAGSPVIMRGRGERLESLPTDAINALRGRRVLIFKPNFGVSTGWAYGRLRAQRQWYCPTEDAEGRVSVWLADPAGADLPLFNNLQGPVFAKYLALPTVLDWIRERHGAPCLMSGSGSSCFVLLGESIDPAAVAATVFECLGSEVFCAVTSLA